MTSQELSVKSTIEKFSEAGLDVEFAKKYHHAKMDLFSLRIHWRTYVSFFGTNKERFEFLHEVSGAVSQTLERTLFETTLLGLRKITDPKGARGGRQSVTIKSFADYLPDEYQKELRILVSQAEKSCEFARDWSGKKIAHADFEYRDGSYSLKPASRQKVHKAIDDVAKVFKWMELTLFHTTLVTHPIPPIEDEVWFLQVLYEGLAAHKEKKKLAKELSRQGSYDAAENLMKYPNWLQRTEPPIDV